MNARRICITVVIAWFMAGTGIADPGVRRVNSVRAVDGFASGIVCCRANYCPKPMPCVTCPSTCGISVPYCPKPMPCVTCPSTCGVWVPYCPKPMPNLCNLTIPCNEPVCPCEMVASPTAP